MDSATRFDDLQPMGPAAPLILVESTSEWVLTPKFDPRLEVGSVFEYLGSLWMVTWESRAGFGADQAH